MSDCYKFHIGLSVKPSVLLAVDKTVLTALRLLSLFVLIFHMLSCHN